MDPPLPIRRARRAVRRPAQAPESTAVERDALDAYLHHLDRCPLLSREEERTLAEEFARTGDPRLADRLAGAHLRLVVKIAREYPSAWRNLADLVQEGNLGLLVAIRHFDPSRGVRLAAYAGWWIRAYILKAIVGGRSLVKVGTSSSRRKLFFNLHKERARLERLGVEPNAELVAARLGVRPDEVTEMELRLAAPEQSMDAPLVGAGGACEHTLLDLLAGPHERRPDVLVEQREFEERMRDTLREFDRELSDRERLLLRERWQREDGAMLAEVGRHVGVSRERVRQIEKRLLERLRRALDRTVGAGVGGLGREALSTG
jgi:RNA polymerase sigma-32 factor